MKQSVCILTAYNSALQPLAAFTLPRMHAFGQAHGYEVRIIHRDDWERKRGWIKIEAIRNSLDSNFDFVFCALCRFLDAGDCNTGHGLDRAASKKRQGTKSRLVVRRRSGVRYGDLSAA